VSDLNFFQNVVVDLNGGDLHSVVYKMYTTNRSVRKCTQ
jgi:hypothetical protein